MKKRFYVMPLALIMSAFLQAQVPMERAKINKTDLFMARTGGYFTYRIPGMVITSKGTILAHCEARKENKEDRGNIDILLKRSEDNGKTWQLKKILDEGSHTVNNFVSIVDKEINRVHFLYNVNYSKCYYMFSDDDGLTFSEALEITSTLAHFKNKYNWKAIGLGPGHGIQLNSGRLIVPLWMKMGGLQPNDTGKYYPSRIAVVYSDDHGKTWKTGEIVEGEAEWRPTESILVQLADGRVMLNIRNEGDEHRRLIAYSSDDGNSWTKPIFDPQLLEPICMGSIIRHSLAENGDKNRIVFANPDNLLNTQGRKKRADRRNLTIKVSYDEGDTWAFCKVLEEGISAYSDLAVANDGTVYCFYERGGVEDMYDTKHLTLARFNLIWLTNGADSWQNE